MTRSPTSLITATLKIIPEGMLNYLSLLGWSLSADQDIFSVDELVANFDVEDVLGNPARFDQKKLEAINADHIRLLEPEVFAQRLRDYLTEYTDFPADYDEQKFAFVADLVQTRIKMLGDAYGLMSFLVTRIPSWSSTRSPQRRTSGKLRCSRWRSLLLAWRNWKSGRRTPLSLYCPRPSSRSLS